MHKFPATPQFVKNNVLHHNRWFSSASLSKCSDATKYSSTILALLLAGPWCVHILIAQNENTCGPHLGQWCSNKVVRCLPVFLVDAQSSLLPCQGPDRHWKQTTTCASMHWPMQQITEIIVTGQSIKSVNIHKRLGSCFGWRLRCTLRNMHRLCWCCLRFRFGFGFGGTPVANVFGHCPILCCAGPSSLISAALRSGRCLERALLVPA